MADSSFKIALGVELDAGSLGTLQSQINSQKFNPIKLSIDTNQVEKQLSSIKSQIQNLSKVKITLTDNSFGGSGSFNVANNIKEANKAYRDLMNLQSRINPLRKELAGLNSSKDFKQIAELSAQLNKLMTDYNNLYKTFEHKMSFDQRDNLNRGFETTSNKIKSINAKALDNADIKSQTQAYKELLSVSKEMNNLELKIGKLKNQGGNTNQITELESQLNTLRETYQSMYDAMNVPLNSEQFSALTSQIIQTHNKLKELNAKALDAKTELASNIKSNIDNGTFKNEIDDIEQRFNKLNIAKEDARRNLGNLNTLYGKMIASDNIDSTIDNYEKYKQVLAETTNQVKSLEREQNASVASMKLSNDKNTFSNSIDIWAKNNSAAAKQFKAELQSIKSQIESADNVKLDNLKSQFTDIQQRAQLAGTTGLSFVDKLTAQFSKLGIYFSAAMVMMKTVSTIKEGINAVVELDTSLVDLQKTANASASQLNSFYVEANDIAKQYGSTTKEIIQSAANWSRLGYSLKDSKMMSQYSSMFASISPDMDVDTATTGLVSTMKAFGITAEDSLDGVISKINAMGNTAALTNGDIVNGLQNSASAMAAMGSSLDETIAIFTAAQEITQDSSKVGNALRAISMRIRGYNEETEEYDEGLKTITGDVVDLTKTASNPNGVSLFTDTTQSEYKTPYQYLKDISEIYDELGAKQQQDLMEKLFGKNRANKQCTCPYVQKCA